MRDCRRRRARNALLAGLALYAVLQLGLIGLMHRSLPWLHDPYYASRLGFLRKRLAMPGERPLTVVVLGSSRTAYGLNPARFEAELSRQLGRPVVVQNFGQLGASSFTFLLWTKRLLDDGVRPDLILYEVAPFRLGARAPEDTQEVYLPTVALRRHEIPLLRRYAGPQREVRDRDWWLQWANAAHSHRFSIISHVCPTLLSFADRVNHWQSMEPSGWLPLPEKFFVADWQSRCEGRMRKMLDDYLPGIGPEAPCVVLLREALDLCRREGVPAALFQMPESPWFRGLYTAEGEARVEAVIRAMREDFRVPMIEARDWVDDETGFTDGHHLLAGAANRFSERFGREGLLPLLRSYPGVPLDGVQARTSSITSP